MERVCCRMWAWDKVVPATIPGPPIWCCRVITYPASTDSIWYYSQVADVAAYINKELSEEAMLGPFDNPPFTPWCQTNPLLTCPKKDSINHRVIMALSWTLPTNVSMNGFTP